MKTNAEANVYRLGGRRGHATSRLRASSVAAGRETPKGTLLSKIRTTHLKPYPVIVACTLLLDESIGSRQAELTFNVCALLAQAIDAITG